MWTSTFVTETIFKRSIRLKQTDRTCWTIQTHSEELNVELFMNITHYVRFILWKVQRLGQALLLVHVNRDYETSVCLSAASQNRK